MEIVFDKINVPSKHSFIARKIVSDLNVPPRIHSHKNYELNFVVSGRGRRIVGNQIANFEEGDLVLLGKDLPHSWEMQKDQSGECIVIHFYENIISSDFFNIPELSVVQELLKDAEKGIFFEGVLIDEIEDRLLRLVDLEGLESYIELLNIFRLLLKMEEREYIAQFGYSQSYKNDLSRLNVVYEYVFHNIETGIRQEEAAALLHMAPGSFCRYFKKKTKRTFMQYVKSVRMRLAAQMLIETEKNISQICYESGYNNLANFNFHFKEYMKKTPSEYRKHFQSIAF